jgi:hypothetical protein
MRLNRSIVQSFAIVSLLISITVAFPLTTDMVRSFSIQTRYASLAMTALTVILLVLSIKGNRVLLISVFSFLLLYLYGMLLAAFMGGIGTAMDSLPMTIFLCLLGLFIVSQRSIVITQSEARILVFYIFVFMLVTIVYGGLVMSMPPHYVFQIQTESHGSIVRYGQGVTKFFGFGVVLCGFLLQSESSVKIRALFLTIALAFLILTFMGGARGDALAALLVFLFIVATRMPLRTKVLTIIVMALFVLLILTYVGLDSFLILGRLAVILEGSAGARDEIYANALQLMGEDIQCTLIGCGFNYFQHSLQLNAGRYPHNQLLEGIIVWGFPLTVGVMMFTLYGLFRALREKGNNDAFPYITIFFLLVGMKSGSIVSSWLFIISVFYYFSFGLDCVLSKRRR